MATDWGMTEPQARKLLELAKNANKMANVRTFPKGERANPGKAIFLGLKNSRTAIVKPYRHGGKQEELDLSEIKLWKAGCDFDTTEVKEISSMNYKTTAATLIQATGHNVSLAHHSKYVIFSNKMKGVWSGNDGRWKNELQKASKWTLENRPHAYRALGKINKTPKQDDAVVLTEEEAEMALLDALTAPTTPVPVSIAAPSAPVVSKDVSTPLNPTVVRPAQLPSIVAAARPMAQATTLNATDNDEFLDLEALLNPNETKLRLAEAERKQAAEEYMTLKRSTAAAFEKLKELNSQVVSLGGRSVMKTAEQTQKPQRKKRIFVRNKIKDILMVSSRLDSNSIYNRLIAVTPELDVPAMNRSLYAMKAEDLVERDANGGWALTAKGRTARMFGSED